MAIESLKAVELWLKGQSEIYGAEFEMIYNEDDLLIDYKTDLTIDGSVYGIDIDEIRDLVLEIKKKNNIIEIIKNLRPIMWFTY